MSLPKRLEERIKEAHEAVHNHPQHVLPIGYRVAIWAEMGPVQRGNRPVNEGRRRRTHLAVQSARHALPVWEERWPDDKTPHEAIQAAVEALNSHGDKALYWDILDKAKSRADNLIIEDSVRFRVGESAVRALVTALQDEDFDPEDIDYGWVDGQLRGEFDDAASTASIAYAGGTALNPESDPDKRLEFWEWWLNEAVPAAYREGTVGND